MIPHSLPDTVLDFSWEPKGERFAIVSSSDPNVGNPGPGITVKTDISFYQLERSKGDFKLLRQCKIIKGLLEAPLRRPSFRNSHRTDQQHHPLVSPGQTCGPRYRRVLNEIGIGVLGSRLQHRRRQEGGRRRFLRNPTSRNRRPLRCYRRRVGS